MVRSWLRGAGLGVLISWKSRCQASRGFSIAQLCLYVEEWQTELREEIETVPGFAVCAAGSALTQQPG